MFKLTVTRLLCPTNRSGWAASVRMYGPVGSDVAVEVGVLAVGVFVNTGVLVIVGVFVITEVEVGVFVTGNVGVGVLVMVAVDVGVLVITAVCVDVGVLTIGVFVMT